MDNKSCLKPVYGKCVLSEMEYNSSQISRTDGVIHWEEGKCPQLLKSSQSLLFLRSWFLYLLIGVEVWVGGLNDKRLAFPCAGLVEENFQYCSLLSREYTIENQQGRFYFPGGSKDADQGFQGVFRGFQEDIHGVPKMLTRGFRGYSGGSRGVFRRFKLVFRGVLGGILMVPRGIHGVPTMLTRGFYPYYPTTSMI